MLKQESQGGTGAGALKENAAGVNTPAGGIPVPVSPDEEPPPYGTLQGDEAGAASPSEVRLEQIEQEQQDESGEEKDEQRAEEAIVGFEEVQDENVGPLFTEMGLL